MHEMNQDNDEILSSYYRQELERSNGQYPVNDNDEIQKALERANRGVGMRDLIVLAVTSFFAILLLLVAPLAKSPTKTRNKLLDSKTDS